MKKQISLSMFIALVAIVLALNPFSVAFAESPTDNYAMTELMRAVKENDKREVDRLISSGADVNETVGDGTTALMMAAFNNNTRLLRCLLDADADINAADSSGMTALMAAASNDSVATIKLLITLGANLYAVDVEGGTAVDWAIAGNAKKAERFLRKQGL